MKVYGRTTDDGHQMMAIAHTTIYVRWSKWKLWRKIG